MPEENSLDAVVWSLGVIIVLFVLISVLYGLCSFINDFSRELKYLNGEIGRTTGAERWHYIRQRRRLWLSLIPFIKY